MAMRALDSMLRQGSSITWDASSFGLSGTIRVRPSGGQSSNFYSIEVNDISVGVSADLWSDPIEVASLEKIKVTGLPDTADGQIRQIEVAGKILVDGLRGTPARFGVTI